MMFAPFNGGLAGHEVLLKEAGLDTRRNEWFKVYDFTTINNASVGDEVHRHWSIMKKEQEDALWCPLGPAQNCIPRNDPNTIADERNGSLHGESAQSSKDPDGRRVIESAESTFFCTIILFWTNMAATISTSVNALYGQMKSKSTTLLSCGINCVSFVVDSLKRKKHKIE